MMDNMGRGLLQFASSRLGRTPEAIRMRLRVLGQRRATDGMMTACEVARLYRCPRYRVENLVRIGTLPSQSIAGSRYYRIDPADCERIKAQLTAPKRTYKDTPPDMGDWRQRYGYSRPYEDVGTRQQAL